MMKTIVPGYYSRQKGLSLIGLLIGLLISVLCILGSLTLYKNLIQVATESKLDSNHDGQLASAMLIVQLEVQSAGFGIDTPAADSIIRYQPSSNEIQLLWRYSSDGGTTFECRGLVEEEDTTDGVFRVLKLVKVESGCDGATLLSDLTWETANPLAVLGRWRVVDDGSDTGVGLDGYITTNGTMFDFELTPNFTCNPYGANPSASDAHLLLAVLVPSSAYLHGATGMGVTRYEYCLPNIYYSASPPP